MVERIVLSSNPRDYINLDSMLMMEKRFDHLIRYFGIKSRGVDRFHQSYKIINKYRQRGIEAVEKQEHVIKGFETEQDKLELLNSFHDCWEIGTALNRLESEDFELCREKLKILMSGVKERYHPDGVNDRGRDTLFELTILSNLKAAGLTTRLNEHPDILTSISDRTYAIECKRLSSQSEKSLQKNLHEASNQLKIYMKPYMKGVIALSIGDYIHGSETLINAKTEDEADEIVEMLVGNFLFKNRHLWETTDAVGSHVVGILFYSSFISKIDEYEIPMNNIYSLLTSPGPDANVNDVMNFVKDFRAIDVPANGYRNNEAVTNFV